MSLSVPCQVCLGRFDDKFNRLWKLSYSSEDNVFDCLVVDDCQIRCYHGLHPEASTLQKLYTTESKIIDSFWCYFDDLSHPACPIKEKKCLLVREKGLLTLIMHSGQTYHVPLPFVVNGVWPLKQGLLLERAVNGAAKDGLAVLFSLSHPLDDLCPVTCRRTHPPLNNETCVDYFMNPAEHVVSVWAGDVPLVLVYNEAENTHSIYITKEAQVEDIPSPVSTPGNKITFSAQGTPHPLSSSAPARYVHFSPSTPVKFSLQVEPSPQGFDNTSCKRRSLLTPDVLKSRALQRVKKESQYESRKESPKQLSSSGGMVVSGGDDSGMKSSGRSPFVDRYKTPPTNDSLPLWYNKAKSLSPQVHYARISPYSQTVDSRSWSTFYSEATLSENFDLLPHLCLHLVWKEDADPRGSHVKTPANDVFVTTDWGGSQYIVMSFSALHQLRFLSLKRTDGDLVVSGPFIAVVDNVKKALYLDKLGMIVALNVAGELELYNGHEKVCNVESSHLSDIGLGLGETVDTIRDGIGKELTVVTSSNRVFQCSISSPLVHPVAVMSLKALCSVMSTHITKLLMTSSYQIFLSAGQRDQWLLFSKWILCCTGISPEEYTALKPHPPLEAALANDPVFNLISGETEMRACGPDEGEQDWFKFSSEWIVPLSGNMASVATALHLVYEDLKLDVHSHHCLYDVAALLCILVRNLNWPSYVDYYVRDHPGLLDHALTSSRTKPTVGPTRELTGSDTSMAEDQPIYSAPVPPGIFQWIHSVLSRNKTWAYPVLNGVCTRSEKILKFYSYFLRRCGLPIHNICESIGGVAMSSQLSNEMEVGTCISTSSGAPSVCECAVDLLSEGGLSLYDIDSLPSGVSLPIRSLLLQCRANPSAKWSPDVCNMIGRNDIALTLHDQNRLSNSLKLEQTVDGDDGMNIDEEVLNLKFPLDARVREVKRLLQSSKPIRVALRQNPETSDHEFVDLQKSYLLNVCQRTMSLSVGRGMFTMATVHPMLFSPMTIPQLNLEGRAPPRNSSVVLEQSDYPTDMIVWPEFHNGVAAGLKIGPGADSIDSTWIVFNQPTSEQGVNSFAGFLLALGLSGHLSSLNSFYIFEYLQQKHEVTVVGLLLGVAAASYGSMNPSIASVLSVFFPPLLPHGSVDLETSVLMQTASMMSLGILYMNSGNRFIAETLLKQIGHSPGPELEFAQNRECYSLTAGLALGMVALGKGNGSVSLSDLNIVDQLCVYMNGGSKQSLMKRDTTGPSHLVLEGDQINIHVTAPGAIVAFGLIYLKTNDSHVANHLAPPTTPYQLDCVRPDFLMLRALSYGLIMWDTVLPSQEWIDSLIPKIVHQYAFKQGEAGSYDVGIDYQTMSQSHVYITAGCCFALGFKFAGSNRQDVYEYLLMKYKEISSRMQSAIIIEQVGRTCMETVLNITLLALSMVMSASGDLGVLRLIRHHHVKISDMTYGRHMATHMALGLLFLGGGRYCLSSSNKAVAALLCSLYPHFPISSSDNRYHLQALRHFYVLATEPRVLVTRECDTGQSCSVPVEIHVQVENEETRALTTPCVIPEWKCLMKIKINSPRYWPLTLDIRDDSVRQSLMKNGTVFVKRHTGCPSYKADHQGPSVPITMMDSEDYQFGGQFELKSSPDKTVEEQWIKEFYSYLCHSEKKFYSTALKNCLTKDQMDLLSTYLELTEVTEIAEMNCVLKSWNIKLCQAFCEFSKAEASLVSIAEHLNAFTLHCEYVSLNLLAQLETSMEPGADADALLMCFLFGQVLPRHLSIKVANRVLLLLQAMPTECKNFVQGKTDLKALYQGGVSPAAAVRNILSSLSPFTEMSV